MTDSAILNYLLGLLVGISFVLIVAYFLHLGDDE